MAPRENRPGRKWNRTGTPGQTQLLGQEGGDQPTTSPGAAPASPVAIAFPPSCSDQLHVSRTDASPPLHTLSVSPSAASPHHHSALVVSSGADGSCRWYGHGDGEEGERGLMEGFSPASPPRIFWNSRKRSANGRSLEKEMEEESRKANEEASAGGGGGGSKPGESPDGTDDDAPMAGDGTEAEDTKAVLSERRRALFEPLGPAGGGVRALSESLLPPPDFDVATYPKGWLVGKKRKLVNVDVVESMRRIAVQEMNRKDREINGLNEQLEEDAKCLEHLQVQLLEERRKRAEVERENAVLHNQISMLMDMLQDADAADPGDDDGMATPPQEHL